jgi:hypothetical protein
MCRIILIRKKRDRSGTGIYHSGLYYSMIVLLKEDEIYKGRGFLLGKVID